MTWLISLLAALIAGIAGLFLSGFIANACVSWYHVSSREGGAGYFVLFLALGGGIAAFLIGLITARLMASHDGAGFGKEVGAALSVVVGLAAIAALVCRLLADVPPKLDGQDLTLEVEFRFPHSTGTDKPPTADGNWRFTFDSLSGHTVRKSAAGVVLTEAARFSEGRWIVPTRVSLFTARGQRSVTLAREDAKDVMGFRLPLPRHPGSEFQDWSDWLPRTQANGEPWPADKMSCRFRIQKVAPPPPSPPLQSEAERKTEEAAKKEAVFAAIPTNSPIEAWFPYLTYEQPQTQRALQQIASRPNVVEELAALVVGDDATMAHAALMCISRLPVPPRELIPPVQAAGRRIAEGIATFNRIPKEEDPAFENAVDPATRFYGWIPAVKTLRAKCGGDFIPELKGILELSRVRPESHCMRVDICRVASHYLHQWAGIPPLPTDPKPD
ncbi:MAG: hypothetical protein JNK85_07685 [Verrucomicrobiales bacterium]|nr:hypothetical protein [Verrucomicrobiales bacterium]